MFKKIRAKQYADADLERIRAIAQGGQEEALEYLRGLGFSFSSRIRALQLVQQCREFLSLHSRSWWVSSRRFYFVTIDHRGPAVEVMR